MVAPAMPAEARAPLIHTRFCGTPGQVPPSKSPDCPSPCHATCPRKHADDEDERYTG